MKKILKALSILKLSLAFGFWGGLYLMAYSFSLEEIKINQNMKNQSLMIGLILAMFFGSKRCYL